MTASIPSKPGSPTTHLPFVERYGLLSGEQLLQCADIVHRLEASRIRFVRLAWADPHGFSRAKLVTVEAFASAVRNGHNINIATSTLDSAGARVFASFTRGGGLGIDEMTGSPNLIVVPDPATFRVLPWDEGVGWVLCDEYFTNGKPFPFSPRQLLKRQIAALGERGWRMSVGLEVEWYLMKVATGVLGEEHIGGPGLRGRPIATLAVEPGYQLHSESGLDQMQPMLLVLADAYEQLGLPLRSIENEWGPGQVECTFAPQDALAAADTMLLFRTATKQICRRHGHLASFMTRPALPRFVASGWHLHQSLSEIATGRNILMPEEGTEPLSKLGLAYLGGLIQHAVPGTAFSTPTVNGYRRFRGFSLAPDRTTWAVDHRGVMVRVLGGPGDPATRLENRVGEPSANPYLFIAQQIASGLAGIDATADPGPQ
jgi:glutamine synthetase